MMKSRVSVWSFIYLVCFLIVPASLLQAAPINFPLTDTAGVKDKLENDFPFTLINVLSPIEFKDLKIKGSINIPTSQIQQGNLLLPRDKGRLIVFYGKGPNSLETRAAAGKAKELGHTNIMIYEKGLHDWVSKREQVVRAIKYPKFKVPLITPSQLDNYDPEKVMFVDIRSETAKQKGTVANATSIPLEIMEQEYIELDKSKKIILIDDAGMQANICSRFLVMKGYTVAAAIKGGARAWRQFHRSKQETEKAEQEAEAKAEAQH